MDDEVGQLLSDARIALTQAQEMLAIANQQSEAALAALNTAIKRAVNASFKEVLASDIPLTDHRKEHRSGKVAKLDVDPEVRSFVLARLDRMTFQAIADEVADHFPKTRRVGKSAIHSWWRRNLRQNGSG